MNQPDSFNYSNSNTDKNYFKKEFFKYLFYWKYFLFSIFLGILVGFTYLRYTPKIYDSSAKIKILDKKESSLEQLSSSDIFTHSKINLENEIEIIKSYPILRQVCENLELNKKIIAIGEIMKSLETSYPFEIKLKTNISDEASYKYRLDISNDGFEIADLKKENVYSFKGSSTKKFKHDLPFEVLNFDKNKFLEDKHEGYMIIIKPIDDMIVSLKKSIVVEQLGRQSDIIELGFKSTNKDYSKKILNELIRVFNNDGIFDRQLVHKRTIDFVNDRYGYLSLELDSIEVAKQLYKSENNLVDLSSNSNLSLAKNIQSEDELFSIESQIELTKLLLETLKNNNSNLLPSNIGINKSEINSLIYEYNNLILSSKKLNQSAGNNNPSIQQIKSVVNETRSNIILTLNNYKQQLYSLKKQLSNQIFSSNNEISKFPQKEKTLRAIERNQTIKETLYLFLLQKREEAEVSYAVTEPSIKIVESAISSKEPSSPNSKFIYVSGFALGLLLPFIFLYILFLFNNKIYSKQQFEELNLPLPLLGEIPEVSETNVLTINSSNDRSPLAESFRVLSSNLKFFAKNIKNQSEVIMVTSTIKGEGKTFSAINLAYTYASLNKKVLIIGADLHNPQIHAYLNIDKDNEGLTDLLAGNISNWKDVIRKTNNDIDCDVIIGGPIPPNPAQLLNNGNLEKLLKNLKTEYDYIIIDTPPCLLVSDTFSISRLSDYMIFVVRCNYTDIDVLDFIKGSAQKGLISENSMFLLNGLGATNRYGYGYAYNYSYGYKYNYSYNYNYGYGYEYKNDDNS